MLQIVRKVGGIAVLSLGLSLVSAAAHAQSREFSGVVDEISAKKLIVDNRKGDKVPFEKLDSTVVEGEKTKWEDIKKKDWVTVEWKFTDKPRKAYKVTVTPPKAEAGEDVQ
ncbi:MAG TPA: hypothetical protein VMH82_17165 [Myxococcota bacterium]|nr:hypothetical protein [Myxococcota bacterium]